MEWNTAERDFIIQSAHAFVQKHGLDGNVAEVGLEVKRKILAEANEEAIAKLTSIEGGADEETEEPEVAGNAAS